MTLNASFFTSTSLNLNIPVLSWQDNFLSNSQGRNMVVILDSSLIQLPNIKSIKSQNSIFHLYHYSPISEDHHFYYTLWQYFLARWPSKFGSLLCIYHAIVRISILKWKPNLGASVLKIFMVTYYIKEKKPHKLLKAIT